MLVIYCYVFGEWNGSGVTLIMLQSVPNYKEQLIDYYGVSILLNKRNLAGLAVLYCLYLGVPLFNNNKNVMHDNIFMHNFQHFPSQPSIPISLIKNHHISNNWLCNKTFTLSGVNEVLGKVIKTSK